MYNPVPRRASRYMTRWQRFKRWWRQLWCRDEEREWHEIVNKPSVRNALRRMAKEVKDGE